MYTIDPGPFTLSCHPQSPSQSIHAIDVVVGESKTGSLMLTFRLVADISGLRITESRPPRRADHLWQHTCFEAFVMAGEGPGYREFNFSPAREWAVYAFRGYRNGGVLEHELSPAIVVHKATDRLELGAEICQGLLPHGRPLRLGLSAVVEDVDGILSYWALRHPPGKPDFHHADAFALQMRNPE
jgi:hypothetical protein